jgi:hypothetical protein
MGKFTILYYAYVVYSLQGPCGKGKIMEIFPQILKEKSIG